MPPRIVLVSSKDSANVGAAARALKNYGFSELYLVAPRCSLDSRAYALASHAGDILDSAVQTDTLAEALTGITWAVGTTARDRASPDNTVLNAREGISNLPETGAALVFGPEDTGLNNADLDRCQAFITIPTAEYASVNLAQAVNVLCYEWFQLSQSQGSFRRLDELATRDQLEGMYGQLMSVLHHIGYTDENRAAGVEHIYRRLFDRAQLSAHEVAALRGLWAQTKWAADQPPERVPGNRAQG